MFYNQMFCEQQKHGNFYSSNNTTTNTIYESKNYLPGKIETASIKQEPIDIDESTKSKIKPCFVLLKRNECEAALKLKAIKNEPEEKKQKLNSVKTKMIKSPDKSDNEVNFTCNQCGQGFAGRTTYMQHLRSCSPAPPGSCPLCDKILSSPQKLRDHLRFVHGESEADQVSISCALCEKKFHSRTALERHILLRHTSANNLNYNCDACKQIFPSKISLKEHLFECHIEDNSNKQNGYHSEIELSNNSSTASTSNSAVNTPTTAAATVTKTTNTNVSPPIIVYSCPHCNTLHANKDRFKKHLGFITPPSFSAHRVSVDAKVLAKQKQPVNCNVCGTKAANLAFLHAHQTGHAEMTRPFACVFQGCGRKFIFRCQLDRHNLIHEVGPNSSNNSAGVKLNITPSPLDHTIDSDGNLKCSHCSRVTKSSAKLYTHIASCHKMANDFRCKTCDSCFPSMKSLKRHCLKKKHIAVDQKPRITQPSPNKTNAIKNKPLPTPNTTSTPISTDNNHNNNTQIINPVTVIKNNMKTESLINSDSVSTSDAFSIYFQSLSSLDSIDFDNDYKDFPGVETQILNGRPAVTAVTSHNYSYEMEQNDDGIQTFHTLQTVPWEPYDFAYYQNLQEEFMETEESVFQDIMSKQTSNTPTQQTQQSIQIQNTPPQILQSAQQQQQIKKPCFLIVKTTEKTQVVKDNKETVNKIVEKINKEVAANNKYEELKTIKDSNKIEERTTCEVVIKTEKKMLDVKEIQKSISNIPPVDDINMEEEKICVPPPVVVQPSTDYNSPAQKSKSKKNKLITCQDCNKVLSSSQSALRHTKYNCPGRDHIKLGSHCTICNVKYGNRQELLKHKIEQHPETTFKCTACNKSFLLAQSLARHQKESCTFREAFICRICKLSFTSVDLLKLHTNSEHQDSIKSCTFCIKKFSTAHSLKRHMARSHKLEYYNNDSSNNTTTNKLDYNKTIIVDNSSGGEGGKSNNNSDLELDLDNTFVMRDGMYVCEFCDTSFETDTLLFGHMSAQHFPNTQWQPSNNST